MNIVSLKMRHSWQENTELLDVHFMEPRQRCGLACLEMVIEYHADRAIAAREILDRAESFEAINQHNDWWHPGQVRVLSSYGLTAWRRNWTAPTQDPSYFADNEGYGSDQMVAVSDQIAGESEIRSDSERFLQAIRESLQAGNPIIASVKSGFSENKENHQVVISGYNQDDLTYEVHDPVHKAGPDTIAEPYLLSYVNYWALFAQQK